MLAWNVLPRERVCVSLCVNVFTRPPSFLLSPSVTSLLIAIRGSRSHSVPNKAGPVVSDQTPMHANTCICRHTKRYVDAAHDLCSPRVSDWDNRKRTLCLFCKNISSPHSLLKLSLSKAVRGDGEFSRGKRLGYHDINLHVSLLLCVQEVGSRATRLLAPVSLGMPACSSEKR